MLALESHRQAVADDVVGVAPLLRSTSRARRTGGRARPHPAAAVSKRPAELIGCTIAITRCPPGTSDARGFRDRGRHLVDVLQRHERDREVGDAGRERQARDVGVHDRAVRQLARSRARAPASLRAPTTCDRRARRSRATRPSPAPRSSVSRPGGGTSSKKRAPWNCWYESWPGRARPARPVRRLLVPRLAHRHGADSARHGRADPPRAGTRRRSGGTRRCTGSPIVDRGGIDLVDLAVGARHEVAGEADQRILFELHDDRVVRRDLRERGQQRGMGDDERPDPAAARRRLPAHVDRTAARAHRPGRHAPQPARRARLHEQLAARAPCPERGRSSARRGRAAARRFPSACPP